MTQEEKLGMLRQLFEMTVADGEIKPVEYKFLYEIALSLEVPIEELEQMIAQELKYKLPKQIDERIIQIYRLAMMMRVDRDIDEQETNMLKAMALQLGLRPDAVVIMLDALKKNPEKILGFDELEKIFSMNAN